MHSHATIKADPVVSSANNERQLEPQEGASRAAANADARPRKGLRAINPKPSPACLNS